MATNNKQMDEHPDKQQYKNTMPYWKTLLLQGKKYHSNTHQKAEISILDDLSVLCVSTRRGLIMGVWNSHTSVGNILGSIIAGLFVSSAWGLSFIVPGIIMASTGVLCFLFLVESTSYFHLLKTCQQDGFA